MKPGVIFSPGAMGVYFTQKVDFYTSAFLGSKEMHR